MTIIINAPKPSNNFLLLKPKRQIRKGDTVIFQVSADGVDVDKEETVTIVDVQEGDGLMKNWQIVVW